MMHKNIGKRVATGWFEYSMWNKNTLARFCVTNYPGGIAVTDRDFFMTGRFSGPVAYWVLLL